MIESPHHIYTDTMLANITVGIYSQNTDTDNQNSHSHNMTKDSGRTHQQTSVEKKKYWKKETGLSYFVFLQVIIL